MMVAAVRGATSAIATALLALVPLVGFVFAVLGDAGPNWSDASPRATSVVALLAVGALAAGAGAAVGAWQAALGGAPTARAAVLAGAGGPALGVVLAAVALPGGVFGAVVVVMVVGGASVAGATAIGRRLE
jgi:hypothetical protein